MGGRDSGVWPMQQEINRNQKIYTYTNQSNSVPSPVSCFQGRGTETLNALVVSEEGGVKG